MNFKDFYNFDLLNECTSVGLSVNGSMILAKNRDRTYCPRIKLVREIVNGLEIAYMYDEDTDYAEGMNEKGIGIVNTTLQGKQDEKEGHKTKKRTRLSRDGFKIRTALGFDNVGEVIKSLDLFDRGLGGHTIIGSPEGIWSIEKLSFGKPTISKQQEGEVIVRTNHGIAYPDQGYQKGDDRESSLSRSMLAQKEARKATCPSDLLELLRRHHKGVQGFLEPYRTNYKVWTSSQILLDLTNLKMTFVVDENTNFLGIENRLPLDYKPKIQIDIEKLETLFVTTSV